MTAFDVYVNGRKVCTAGLKGAGVVVSAITWVAGASRQRKAEDLDFRVSGLISRLDTHVDWFHRQLKAGDEVRIVVCRKGSADAPKRTRRYPKAERMKRERDYVQRKAEEFGWRVVK